jgi:pyruvate dehydrogenase E1 component alpha subunit
MKLSKKKMIEMYTVMLKIREFEERIAGIAAAGRIPGFVHLYVGEESVAAGVCAVLRNTDYITSTHRGHGHLIAKGGDIKKMMAELLAKRTGYCKGKGGSMHIADLDLGILGANGIVGAGPPLATGAALASQVLDKDDVSVTFFGDGASNQGTVHEAMNLAAIWKLPTIFVVENNGYAEFTAQARHQAIENIADRAAGYGMPGVVVDGNDVIAVCKAADAAVTQARKGKGPTLIECKTFRIHGHFAGDPQDYRPEGEIEAWKKKDPILRFEKELIRLKAVTKKKIKEIRDSIIDEFNEAVRFAEESPDPDLSELYTDVYAD